MVSRSGYVAEPENAARREGEAMWRQDETLRCTREGAECCISDAKAREAMPSGDGGPPGLLLSIERFEERSMYLRGGLDLFECELAGGYFL